MSKANFKCIMFNIDDDGNVVDQLYISEEQPQIVYPHGCEFYGERRDYWLTLDKDLHEKAP